MSKLFLVLLMFIIVVQLATVITMSIQDYNKSLYKIDARLLRMLESNERIKAVIFFHGIDYRSLLEIRAKYGVGGVKRSLRSESLAVQGFYEQVIDSLGGRVLTKFWIVNAILVEIEAGKLPIIASYPEVERITPNFEVHIDGYRKDYNVTISSTVVSWGINRTRAPQVWQMGYNGTGIRICTIDTGVDVTHPALKGKMLTLDPQSPYYPGGWMEFDSNGNPILSQPHDTHGHGTHVSGTALGGDGKRIVIGVAPGATLMHALALPYGRGTFAAIIGALEWAADPYYIDPENNEKIYTGLPAHIVSMSFGASNYYGSEFLEPIRNLLLLNIVPVAAIGNSGYGSTSNPGNIWGVFGIGATDEDDNVAYFSSGGIVYWPVTPPSWPFNDTYPQMYIKPDFSAPGVRIVSSLPGGGYAAWSGTSMATPHVAGIVALILDATRWDEYPINDLPEKIYGILKATSLDLGEPGQDPRYGWGIVDAVKAVEKALSIAKISGVKGIVLDSVDDSPIGYATVYAYDDEGTLVASAKTNSTGYYILPLDPGHYTLVFTGFGYNNRSVEVDVVVYNGTVTGKVYDRVSGNPIPGAEIIVEETGETVYSGSDGSYSLSLFPGRYTLHVNAIGYFSSEKKIIIGEGELLVVDHFLYPLNASATLMVSVKELFTGDPIEGMNVSIMELGISNTTNSTGVATIEGVMPGDYTIMIRGGRYADRVMEVALEPGLNTYTIETTYEVAVMSADSVKFGEDIRQMLVQRGYPAYSIKLLEPGEKVPGLAVLIVNYFGVAPGWDGFHDMLEYYDEQNTSIIFLDSWGAYYYFAGYVIYKYRNNLLSSGYPAPIGRNDGYEQGVMVRSLNTSHPIFWGISFEDGDKFYIASSPTDNADYAAYPQVSAPENTSLELLGEIVKGATVYGYSIIIWNRTNDPVKYVFMSIGASFHWAMYTDKGQDMKYSDNIGKLIMNTIKWLTGTLQPVNTTVIKPITCKKEVIEPLAYSWLQVRLDRQPYGWLTGTIVAGDTGKPIRNAHVIVAGTPVKATTNENGTFKIWLPEGTYVIRIMAPGYYEDVETVTIRIGETTGISKKLIRQPRALILFDHMGQLKKLLEENGWYAEDTRDWNLAIERADFFDVIILAGEYMGTHAFWPSQEEFTNLLEATYEHKLGIVFMNNYFEYRYLKEFPYGINILYYYNRDPGSIGADYDKGPVYYKVVSEHPILEGYRLGDRVYVVDGGDYDYAWFNKWNGQVIAYIGSETGGVRGIGIGVKETEYGTRWVLLAGMAPEQWTNTQHWTHEAEELFLRAVTWASYRIVNITVEPERVHVGDTLKVTIPPLPGIVYSIVLDTTVVYENILGGDTPTSFFLRTPLLTMGLHKIALISRGRYYGETYFYVEPKIVLQNDTVVTKGKIMLNITGLPGDDTILVYIDDNYVSMAFSNGPGPLILTLNIPDFVGTGYHVLNIRLANGQVIGAAPFYINESADEKIIVMLDDIELRLQNITSIVDQVAGISGSLSDMKYNITISLHEILSHLLLTKDKVNKLTVAINSADASLRSLEPGIEEIKNQLREIQNRIDSTGSETYTKLGKMHDELIMIRSNTSNIDKNIKLNTVILSIIVILSMAINLLFVIRKK